jgi:hypothetical protein
LPIRRRQFAHRRVIARRREQGPRRHQAGRNQLLDGEQMDGSAVEIGVGDDRMGRAEVNADQITGCVGSSDGSALPAQGGLGAGIFHDSPDIIGRRGCR